MATDVFTGFTEGTVKAVGKEEIAKVHFIYNDYSCLRADLCCRSTKLLNSGLASAKLASLLTKVWRTVCYNPTTSTRSKFGRTLELIRTKSVSKGGQFHGGST